MALWSWQRCLLEYITVRYVSTHNKKIGLLYRLIQLTAMAYLIGWVFLTKKGYQSKDDTIESSVVTKVKGVAHVNTTFTDFWGPEDYLIPEEGGNVIFIITNYMEIPSQTLGHCAEDLTVPGANCTTNENCTEGEALRSGNGFMTGNCLESPIQNTCEIYGWCPLKNPKIDNVLREAENFTVYIRNFIRFSQFNFSVSNISKDKHKLYLKSCQHERDLDCPMFRLGDIVSNAGYDFSDIALKGGSIGVMIEWSCDLDRSQACHPKYSFMNLGSHQPVNASFYFRFARYYYNATGHRLRALYKVHGIHLEIMVFGSARKFSIIPTIVNIASVLTLTTAGSYLCDLILFYITKKKTVHGAENTDGMTKNDKEIPFKTMPDGLKRKFSL